MTWNAALPGTTEKIRSLSSVITPNWQAIERGSDLPVGVGGMLQMRSVQLSDRSAVADSGDPTSNVGTHYLYSKEDAGAVQEAFMRDSAGLIIQITNGGKIGATDVNFEMDSVSFDGTRTYNENNVVSAWGYVASNALSYGNGVGSVVNDSTGKYTINFTSGRLTTTNYAVVGMTTGIGRVSWGASLVKTTAAFAIELSNSSGALGDADFFFQVVGGQ